MAPRVPRGPTVRGDDNVSDLISVTNLSKFFGEREALHIDNLQLSEGTTLAVIGPNGAGKTTLLRILSGLWLPTSAERLEVLGCNLADTGDRRSRKYLSRQIGLAGSSSQLFGTLTVRENLDYACRLYAVPRAQREAAIARALALCGIRDRADDRIWSLSTGLRQRANIARAIVTSPKLLFLDEPTSGLDPIAAAALHDTFRALAAEGVTIVLCTHTMQEVDDLSQRVVFLNGGRILADGAPDELRAQAGEWVWTSRVPAAVLPDLLAEVAAVAGGRVIQGARLGDAVEVSVYGAVSAQLFEARGLAYERHAPQLRDAFFLLGGGSDER